MVGHGRRLRAGRRAASRTSTCTPRPGVGNAMGAIFNAQANKSPLLVTAGQQVRAQITMQANLTNRDATRGAAAVRQVELRAAARAGRAGRARARDPPRVAAAARARRSSRSRWTTGTSRPTTPRRARVVARRVDRPRRRRPRGGARRWRARLEAAREPGAGRRARHRRQRRLGRGGRAGRAPAPAGVGDARARRRAHRLPRGPCRTSRASCRRRSARSARRSRATTSCSSSARRCSPTTRTSPGRCCPRAPTLVAITSDPDEAARAPMGDAIVADVRAHARGARSPRSASPTAPPPEPRRRRRRRPRTATRSAAGAVHATLAEVLPDDGDRRARVAVEHAGAAQPAAALAAGQLLLLRRRRPRLRPRAPRIGVQLAQPDRPVVCVLGEGSAQYAITGFWTAAAYNVPVTFLCCATTSTRSSSGSPSSSRSTGAPGLDLPGARDRRDRAAATASTSRRVRGRDELREALDDRRSAADAPRLVEVDGRARACRCSDGGRRRRPPIGRARPRPRRAGGRHARAAALASSSRCSAPTACCSRVARPRPLRLRREPVPADPAGGRDGARRRTTSRRCSPTARSTGIAGHASAPAARASTARPRPTASWSTSAATSPASRARGRGARVRVKPGTVLGHVNRGAGQAPAPPRPRPGLDRHRDRRRRDRQQLAAACAAASCTTPTRRCAR